MHLNVYKNFFEDLKNDPNYSRYAAYENDDFIIAAISSPFYSKNPRLINELSVYVYFANLNKDIVVRKEYAWESLSRTYIGHMPLREMNKNGFSSISWFDYKYKKRKPTSFCFDTESFKGFIKYKDLEEKYGLTFWIYERPETKDIMEETISVYEYGNHVVLIPSIVNIQAFYAKSEANSLFDALGSPQGLSLMVNSSGYEMDMETYQNFYHIYATGLSHIADAKMLLYYSYDKDITDIFNQCAMDISFGKKIEAKIPKKGLINFKADSFTNRYGEKTISFVVSIHASNLSDEVVHQVGSYIKFHHPKAYLWAQSRENDENSSPMKDTPSTNILDDNKKVDTSEIPMEVEAKDMYTSSTGSIGLEIEVVSPGERERGILRRSPKRDKNIKFPSSRTPRGGAGEGKSIENKSSSEVLEDIQEADSLSSTMDIAKLLIDKGFDVEHKTFYIPFSKKKSTRPVFCYVDSEKKQRRRCFVLKASGVYTYRTIVFFYVQVETKQDQTKKEILIIKKNDDFDTMVEDVIMPAILDQVEKGNRKWLKDRNDILPGEYYFSMRRMKAESGTHFLDRIFYRVIKE